MKNLCKINNEAHSIVDFYESIPDYNEIYYLPEEDFYSKIETLRGTCCNLKEKSKSRHSRRRSRNSSNNNQHFTESEKNITEILTCKCNSLLCGCSMKHNNFYIDLEEYRSPYSLTKSKKSKKKTKTSKRQKKLSTRSHSISPIKNEEHFIICPKQMHSDSQKANEKKNESTASLIENKYTGSSLVKQRSRSHETLSTPNHKIGTAHHQNPLTSTTTIRAKKCRKLKNEDHHIKLDTLFDNNETISSSSQASSSKYDEDIIQDSVPPRLNHAANLRMSYIKNKYREYDDEEYRTRSKSRTSQSEWAVKNNSAWQILKTNKKGIDDILQRLARRKVEEKQLQREHELNMELMRQRVKSSPLLLEGLYDTWKQNYKHLCVKKPNQQRKE